MRIQSPIHAVRFSGEPSEKQPYRSLIDDDTTTGSSSSRVQYKAPPKSSGNSLLGLLRKNLTKQESASTRAKKQIQEHIKAEEKERKRVLKDLYYLALAYSHRTDLQKMLLNGHYYDQGVNQFNSDITHFPPGVKDLNLATEIPSYTLGMSKSGKIYKEVMGDYGGEYHKHRPLRAPNKHSLDVQQAYPLDDMGDLLAPRPRRTLNGEVATHKSPYANVVGNNFAFKHFVKPVRKITPAERKLLSENIVKRQEIEAEIEVIKKERLEPINKKLAQSKLDLQLMEEATMPMLDQPYTDDDTTSEITQFSSNFNDDTTSTRNFIG